MIRLFYFVAILFLSSTKLFSQNYDLSLGLIFSPSIASAYKPVAETAYAPRFSLGGGIEIKYRLNSPFYITSGANIIDRGFIVEDYLIRSDGTLIGFYTLHEHEYYLSIPTVLIYQPNHLFVGVGPNFNFYLDRKTEVEGIDENVNVIYNDQKFLFGAQMTLGYEAEISNQLFISGAIFTNATFEFNLINYGLDFGLKYALCSKEK